MSTISIYSPKEITLDIETDVHIASFDYYSGIEYARLKGLKQSVYFADVFARTHYIVCCGDVMVRVEPVDYPELNRRNI